MTRSTTLLALMLSLTATPLARAEVPALLPVQGVLTDDQGQALAGPVDLVLRIYDAASGGSELFGEELLAVRLEQGAFALSLGATRPLYLGALAGSRELWLEVSVGGEALSRVQLQSVPYAISSYSCETLGGLGAADFALASHAHTEYAPQSHSHSGYALTSHNHDRSYVGLGAADSITQVMLADGSVGAAELANGAVGSSQLANYAVTAGKLAANAVTAAHVADHALPASKIMGGVYSDKSAVQSFTASVSVLPGTVNDAVAACADANDLMLSGQCDVLAAEKVYLVRWRYSNLSSNTNAASLTCSYRSYDSTNTISVSATIHCLAVD